MLVAGVLLTGCAMSKETYLPDGRLGHSISCDGSAVEAPHERLAHLELVAPRHGTNWQPFLDSLTLPAVARPDKRNAT
jgi:hypothetical protein